MLYIRRNRLSDDWCGLLRDANRDPGRKETRPHKQVYPRMDGGLAHEVTLEVRRKRRHFLGEVEKSVLQLVVAPLGGKVRKLGSQSHRQSL